MNILILLIFIGIVLVLAAFILFLTAVKNEDFDHIEELSLLPLKDEKYGK